jgi:hypothetical protein
VSVRFYSGYVVGRRIYLREVSVVMACHLYNAAAPRSENHKFEASWQRKGLFKVLTVREVFMLGPAERPPAA